MARIKQMFLSSSIFARTVLKIFKIYAHNVKKLSALFLFFTLTAALLFSLDKKIAFLESGPHQCTGMPGIGMNTLHGYNGLYKLPLDSSKAAPKTKTAGERLVYVYFTKSNVPVFESWKPIKTSRQTIYHSEANNVFIYLHSGGWALFFDFGFDEIKDSSEFFQFFDNIIQQMIFFLKSGDIFSEVSFPAIVEYE